jgi:hypothetical protein
MFLARLDHHHVAAANVFRRLAPPLDANASADDQKPLSPGVAMPVGPCARVELDAVDMNRHAACIRRDFCRAHPTGKAFRVDRNSFCILTTPYFHDVTINRRDTPWPIG